MNLILPAFLTLMGLSLNGNAYEFNDDPTSDAQPDMEILFPDEAPYRPVAENFEITAVYAVNDTMNLVCYDIDLIGDGQMQRLLSTYNNQGRWCSQQLLDTNPQGIFIPDFQIIDKKSQNVSAINQDSALETSIADAPEGGLNYMVRKTCKLTVLNHDTGDEDTYILDNITITYRIDNSGRISMIESRPLPNDKQQFDSRYTIVTPD